MENLARLLREPSWGWRTPDGAVPRPAWGAVLAEVARNVNVLRDRRNLSTFLLFAGFVLAGPACLVSFATWAWSWSGLAVALAYFWTYTVLTNTIWWHRLASHRAFRLRSRVLPRLFRVLTPIWLPVEAYAIPHRVHHASPDRPGDPYTPLSGYLACMSTEWTTGILDPDMREEDFDTARKLIEHTGVPLSSYVEFRRWGTVQTLGSLAADALLSIALHVGLLAWLGGARWVVAAYAGLTVAHFFNLDFNYSAHGRGVAAHADGWDFCRDDLSLNQRAPGFIGGEWHNNHHLFPGSMRSGFLPGQLDLPYLIVRALERLGLVADVQDHRALFLARISGAAAAEPVSRATGSPGS